jgi:acetylornithine deacetylase/succinyl-diaminopimelate desuccinylase-like protein
LQKLKSVEAVMSRSDGTDGAAGTDGAGQPDATSQASGHDVLARVGEWVAAHRDECVRELADWVRQPSVSSDGTGFPAATDYGAELVRRCGLTPEIVPTKGRPLILGTGQTGTAATGQTGAPHVLVYGHYDVQPPGPLADWVSPPFEPTIREGRMYGRGTGDNKGQHLAQLLALRALKEITGSLPCPTTVLLDGEEEIGSPSLAAALRTRYPAGTSNKTYQADQASQPDLAVWSDGPVHESGRSTVVLGVRGTVIFQLRAKGAVSPLHSGNWGGVAPNPAWRLVHLLTSMRAPDGTVLIEGAHGGAAPLGPAEQAALDALPIDVTAVLKELDVTELEPPAGRGYYERLSTPTFTINSLTCDDAGEHRTIIPNVAIAKCDMRLVAGQRTADVMSAIERHVARHDPAVEVTFRGTMEPQRTPVDSPYTEAVLRGARAGLGEEPLLTPALGGSLPIAEFGETLNIPCYGIPFANADERNHAPNENIEVDRFLRGISGAAGVILALGGQL